MIEVHGSMQNNHQGDNHIIIPHINVRLLLMTFFEGRLNTESEDIYIGHTRSEDESVCKRTN
jgi:hypothetical protein